MPDTRSPDAVEAAWEAYDSFVQVGGSSPQVRRYLRENIEAALAEAVTDRRPPDAVEAAPNLREAAQRVMDSHRQGYWNVVEFDALEAALAARSAPLDVERLARAMEAVDMEWPAHTADVMAEAIAAEYAALATPPERFDRSWWHYADDCPVSPRSDPKDAIQESRAGGGPPRNR